MAKIQIENQASEAWLTTLEQRTYLMLSSLSSSVPQISVQFVELPADGVMPRRFRCSARSSQLVDANCEVAVEHPDGSEAIEGALQRFRRNIKRSRKKTRQSNVQASAIRRTN